MYPYFALTNLVMVYLLGATVAALRLGRGPASLAAVANVVALDFFFVPPRFTFAISNLEYLLTFAVMLVIALVIANLVASVRAQSRVAGARERRTSLLYAMSRELAATRELQQLGARRDQARRRDVLRAAPRCCCPMRRAACISPRSADAPDSLENADLSVAQWVFDHGRPAGLGTDTLARRRRSVPAAHGHAANARRARRAAHPAPPLAAARAAPSARDLCRPDCAGDRARTAGRGGRAAARVAVETESLRNTLLASISHDLRTPLAAITAASHALNDPRLSRTRKRAHSLPASIEAKAREMSELISNVLDLMSFEVRRGAPAARLAARRRSGRSALARLEGRFDAHPVEVALPADLPPVNVDASLVTRVLVNLLENAVKHTPPGTHITVSAGLEGEAVRVVIDDNGPGLPPGQPERLFAKFQRGTTETGGRRGAGLGLTICKAIVDAHGGHISAMQRPGGGARFMFTLPTHGGLAALPSLSRPRSSHWRP